MFLAALAGTVLAAAVRHLGGRFSAAVAGIVSLVFSVACPVSGHHALGLWWLAQMGVTTAMLAVCVAALGHARTSG